MYRKCHGIALVASVMVMPPVAAAQTSAAARGGAVRAAMAPPAGSATANLRCTASGEGVPRSVLGRALSAVGVPSAPGQVLRLEYQEAMLQDYQSDRTYPPYFSLYLRTRGWFDPAGGGLREDGLGGTFPGTEFPGGVSRLVGPKASWTIRDTLVTAQADDAFGATSRPMNPWAVLVDFQHSPDAAVAGRCIYRDYPRIALTRTGPFGPERLLLDAKTFVPVALVREEPHYLWGQVQVEYVWSNWHLVTPDGRYPLTAFRVVDGTSDVSRVATATTLVPADSAPSVAIPDTALTVPVTPSPFARPEAPDTVRVGANAFLLRNRYYTIAVLLARDTVFVLDATLGDPRAQMDSTWIGRLFPGRHPIVVVVTDLAWPHVAGVRYWVAAGATIVSHRASRAFLQRVVDRRWTWGPDLLEQRRAHSRFVFRAVDDSLRLADGAIVLHPIDGVASEGALLAWVPGERFLWASDYIQDLRRKTAYGLEVLRATERVGITPERFAAEHVGLTPWHTVDSLFADLRRPPQPAPGDVSGGRLGLGRLTKHATVTAPSRPPRDMGEQVQVLTTGTWRGRPTLISVQRFETPRGTIVDSSVNDLATLAPIRHHSSGAGRTMALDFAGARVTGRYAPADSAALAIDQHFAARPYDSNVFDLVIASLPLAGGYAAHVPFYVYEQGGVVWYDVGVTGRERTTLRDGAAVDTWALTVQEAGRLRARLWITDAPREVVRSTYYISPGMEYTVSR